MFCFVNVGYINISVSLTLTLVDYMSAVYVFVRRKQLQGGIDKAKFNISRESL